MHALHSLFLLFYICFLPFFPSSNDLLAFSSSFLPPPSLSIFPSLLLPLSWPYTTLLIWLFRKLSLTITLSSSVSPSHSPSVLSSAWRQRGERDRLSLSDWSEKATPSALAVLSGCYELTRDVWFKVSALSHSRTSILNAPAKCLCSYLSAYRLVFESVLLD